MEQEIKSCPFCGREGSLEYDKSAKSWFVECDNGCCVQNIFGMTREEAIELWNKRV